MATIKFELSVKGDKQAEKDKQAKPNDRPEFQVLVNCGTAAQRIRLRCRTGLYGFREYWNATAQTHKIPKNINPLERPEVVEVNEKLATLKAKLETAVANTHETAIDRAWLAAIVEDVLHPTKKETAVTDAPKTLATAIKDFIAAAPTTIKTGGKTPMTARRINQYKQTLNLLERMGETQLTIEQADKAFYDRFVMWMYGQGKKYNTIALHVKCIKAVINALPASERMGVEFIEKRKCVATWDPVDNIALTEEELQRLADLDLATQPYLDRVRDQFLLLCWTGCRYSDLHKLTQRYIVHDDTDGDYFKLEQQKTGARVEIPILPPIVPILEKYGYNPPEPISNQRFNDFIKEVARLAGFNEEVSVHHTKQDKGMAMPGSVETRRPKWQAVTAHTARRSFATNMYKRGFDALSIMGVTGHKTQDAFLAYIKVSQAEHAQRLRQGFMAQWEKK